MTGTWWEWCSASQSLPGYNQCFAVDCICLVLDLITGFLQNLSQTDLFNVTTEGTGTWVARQMWVCALSLNWKQMSHVSQLPWPETGSGHSISHFFSSRGVDDASGQKCCCQAWFRHIRSCCFSAEGKEWVRLIAVTYQEGQEGRLTETGQSVVSKRVRLHGMGTLAPVSHSSTHSKISHSHL